MSKTAVKEKGGQPRDAEPGVVKALIFDMDGTVTDSTETDYMAWKKVFAEYNADFSYGEYVKVLGVKSTDILQQFLGLGPEELDRALKRKLHYFFQIVEEQGLSSIPHVESFLKKAREMSLQIALATGARKEKSDRVLEKVRLRQYFDVFITAEDVEKGKPDPEIFLRAARKLGASPEEVIVIEDAENGVLAAKKAGMKCIALTTTTGIDRLQPADLIVESFRSPELGEFLEQHRKK
jgi:beta-phosphoglucomutase family hydrolase